MKNFSDYLIALRGKISIPGEIDDTKSYKLLLDGEFISVKENNNEDGTFTKEYIFKPLMGQIEADNGAITRIKDVRKQSQKMRVIINKEWAISNSGVDQEDFYNKRMTGIMIRMINGEI